MGKAFDELFAADMARYDGTADRWHRKFHYLLRKAQTADNKIVRRIYAYWFASFNRKYGNEVHHKTKIGKGFRIVHPYGVTINYRAIIGENVNVHKGVTIGKEHRGKREGAPIIGNCVYIGINATIVGKVKIGSDVVIAPNTFVNCDVPDHSVVFGNPCIIKHRDNATEKYVINIVQ